jgi:hypothetical protein
MFRITSLGEIMALPRAFVSFGGSFLRHNAEVRRETELFSMKGFVREQANAFLNGVGPITFGFPNKRGSDSGGKNA